MHITVQEMRVGKFSDTTEIRLHSDLIEAVEAYVDTETTYWDDTSRRDIIDIHALAVYWDKNRECCVVKEMSSFLTYCSIEKLCFSVAYTYDVKL